LLEKKEGSGWDMANRTGSPMVREGKSGGKWLEREVE
jgi:hypothetical protein